MRSPARNLRRAVVGVRHVLTGPSAPRDDVRLIVYPFDLNPYQEMLYGAIRASGTTCIVVYVRRRRHLGPIPFFGQVAMARMRGFRLLHLHWPQFALRFDGRFLPRLSLLNARLSLWWIRALGITLVWTVHNAVPHEPETADDVAVGRILARDAGRKIVHSSATIEELASMGADTDRVSVIPHGAYTESYREANRSEARRTLQVPESVRVVMFFGQIRPYKGVEDLLEAWNDVPAAAAPTAPGPFLIIAGKCDDDAMRRRLERRVGVRFDQGYVPQGTVPLYFAAADVVVLPFRQVTTSGSALLALSLGRPVVAPRIGALRDLPEDVGFLYETGGLVHALTAAVTAPAAELDQRSQAARRYADSISWDHIAAATLDVYRELASGRR